MGGPLKEAEDINWQRRTLLCLTKVGVNKDVAGTPRELARRAVRKGGTGGTGAGKQTVEGIVAVCQPEGSPACGQAET